MNIHLFPDNSEGYHYHEGDTVYVNEDFHSTWNICKAGTFGKIEFRDSKDRNNGIAETISYLYMRSDDGYCHAHLACRFDPSMETRHNATTVYVSNEGKPLLDQFKEDL